MDPHEHQHSPEEGVDLPIPTANPIITAFGVTLLAAGVVTSLIISLVGLIIGLIGAIGWFRDVFPTPKHELYPLAEADRRPKPVRVSPRRISHLHYGEASHRVRIPVEVHRYSAGIIGGLAGGAAMAVLARHTALSFSIASGTRLICWPLPVFRLLAPQAWSNCGNLTVQGWRWRY